MYENLNIIFIIANFLNVSFKRKRMIQKKLYTEYILLYRKNTIQLDNLKKLMEKDVMDEPTPRRSKVPLQVNSYTHSAVTITHI